MIVQWCISLRSDTHYQMVLKPTLIVTSSYIVIHIIIIIIIIILIIIIIVVYLYLCTYRGLWEYR
jgi:hypothetical protein